MVKSRVKSEHVLPCLVTDRAGFCVLPFMYTSYIHIYICIHGSRLKPTSFGCYAGEIGVDANCSGASFTTVASESC